MAGLETLDGPDALAEMLAKLGADRTIFSLDLVERPPADRDAQRLEVR